MTESGAGREPAHNEDDEISLMTVGSLLLRWRRTIIALALLGAVLGLAVGLLSQRVYMSAATFIPQGSESGATSGLALAASQLGLRVPSAGGGWGPPIYVELLHSRSLLERIALDTVSVAEQGGGRVALMDLLEVEAPTPAQRTERAVRALGNLITATEDKKLGAVKVTVTTRWPSVSLTLVERLVRGVNQFNLETRKSQATAERQFVEGRAEEAGRALREVEDRLQTFLQRNRAIGGSPELGFERDRLQREVALRQQVYTTLLQTREEARIREVRDMPVITELEDPRLPLISESRGTAIKLILGALAGGFLGIVIAFLADAMVAARRAPSEEAREFFQLVEEVTPRFLKRGAR